MFKNVDWKKSFQIAAGILAATLIATVWLTVYRSGKVLPTEDNAATAETAETADTVNTPEDVTPEDTADADELVGYITFYDEDGKVIADTSDEAENMEYGTITFNDDLTPVGSISFNLDEEAPVETEEQPVEAADTVSAAAEETAAVEETTVAEAEPVAQTSAASTITDGRPRFRVPSLGIDVGISYDWSQSTIDAYDTALWQDCSAYVPGIVYLQDHADQAFAPLPSMTAGTYCYVDYPDGRTDTYVCTGGTVGYNTGTGVYYEDGTLITNPGGLILLTCCDETGYAEYVRFIQPC